MHICQPRQPSPLGAIPDAEGVNFSFFFQHATPVELLLFDTPASTQPSEICSTLSKTFYYWHVCSALVASVDSSLLRTQPTCNGDKKK